MPLSISSFTSARRHKRDFSGVISIEDPLTRHRLRFHRLPHPAHLVLQFADLEVPVPSPFDQRGMFRMATLDQITSAMAFGQAHADLLVHCHAGISRSPAIALGLLMQRFGTEDAAYDELARICPDAVPNRHVVLLIDQHLGSRLVDHLAAWDALDPRNRRRRLLQRRAYFLEGGIPLEPELRDISLFASR